MPVYDYECQACARFFTEFRPMSESAAPAPCPECKADARRVLAAPKTGGHFVQDDLEPYQSMVTGEVVSSRKRHREILRSHNLIEVGNETNYLTSKPVTTPPGLKETLIRQVHKHRGS